MTGSPPCRRVAQRLPEPRLVLRDHGVGGVEHHLGGAIVLLEPDHAGPGEVALEVAHVPHLGAAPAVDGLVVIADREDVAVAAEEANQLVLRPVGVLELVHQQEVEAPLPGRQPVRMLPEERQRMQHQVVEVHRVLGPERRRQRPMQVGGDLGERVVRGGRSQGIGPTASGSSRRR